MVSEHFIMKNNVMVMSLHRFKAGGTVRGRPQVGKVAT